MGEMKKLLETVVNAATHPLTIGFAIGLSAALMFFKWRSGPVNKGLELSLIIKKTYDRRFGFIS